jgi:predicted small secreted protein
MKRITFLTALFTLTVLTSACHTISGAGQDVSAGGHDISHAANTD